MGNNLIEVPVILSLGDIVCQSQLVQTSDGGNWILTQEMVLKPKNGLRKFTTVPDSSKAWQGERGS